MVRETNRKDYTGFSLEKELVDEIRQYMKKHPERHYNTIIEFIKEAIRDKLDPIEIYINDDHLDTLSSKISSEILIEINKKLKHIQKKNHK